jgi:NAD(P)H-hydrate epimerase
MTLPEEVYPVAAVREMDRRAIDDAGIAGYELMTRAGRATLHEARRRFPGTCDWQVVCGAGNNAGDGFVVARLAMEQGLSATVVCLVDPARLQGDARTAHDDYVAVGGRVGRWKGGLDEGADLLVDGLLGSGLERPVEGAFADAVRAINAHPSPVVALDLPSGLHGDTGAVLGVAVKADMTTTFVGLKPGLFLEDGPELAGEIAFAGLDIPAACRNPSEAVYRRISSALLDRALPPRPRKSHKGFFGHVLVVGGGPGMPGAARLCGEAALRAGAGRVSLATHPSHAAAIVQTRPELMAHGIENPRDLDALLETMDVVAFGPGLGKSDWARALYAVVTDSVLPAVWDADALNLLAEQPKAAPGRVLTPHPGEAGTLLGETAADIESDRKAALARLHERFGGPVVLKGAGTLVSSPNGAPWLSTSGNPGMAAPGMGDVLTGIVAAMLAQGLEPDMAAAVAVEAHARAGDRAAAGGERGLLASDLLAELRAVINPR